MNLNKAKSRINYGQHSKTKGFTLLELLIVIVIIGIGTQFALPEMGLLLDKKRLSSSSNSVFTTMQLARSEAITRQQRIVVCPSADGLVCSDAAVWSNYLIVYVESATNDFTRENNEALLRSTKLPGRGISVTPSTTDAAYAYLPNGQVLGSANARSVGFAINDNNTNTAIAYRVSVSRTGATNAEKYTPIITTP